MKKLFLVNFTFQFRASPFCSHQVSCFCKNTCKMGSICRDSLKKTNKFSLFCYFFGKNGTYLKKLSYFCTNLYKF